MKRNGDDAPKESNKECFTENQYTCLRRKLKSKTFNRCSQILLKTTVTFIVTVTKCGKVFSGDKPARE